MSWLKIHNENLDLQRVTQKDALKELLNKEEVEYCQHSHIEWLTLGDLNTTFFADRTKQRSAKSILLGNINVEGTQMNTKYS